MRAHVDATIQDGEDQSGTTAGLPAPGRRWTPHHKAAIVRAIRAHKLTFAEAFLLYGLTTEELAAWERAFDWGGARGLTRAGLQKQRDLQHKVSRP